MLPFEDWGLIPYAEALERQIQYVETIAVTDSPGCLIFCQHPAVVTLGRQTQSEDLFAWQGDTVEVSRGGRATYHGPNQLVIYPLINLNHANSSRPARDIHAFLRGLEQKIASTLQEFGAMGIESQKDQKAGLWVQDKKICSVGIAVKKWITYHGAAVNLYHDPRAFQGLKPCGLSPNQMISLEETTNSRCDLDLFKNRLREQFIDGI